MLGIKLHETEEFLKVLLRSFNIVHDHNGAEGGKKNSRLKTISSHSAVFFVSRKMAGIKTP